MQLGIRPIQSQVQALNNALELGWNGLSAKALV